MEEKEGWSAKERKAIDWKRSLRKQCKENTVVGGRGGGRKEPRQIPGGAEKEGFERNAQSAAQVLMQWGRRAHGQKAVGHGKSRKSSGKTKRLLGVKMKETGGWVHRGL